MVRTPVVLRIPLVQPLIDVGCMCVIEFIVTASAEEEVSQCNRLIGDGGTRRWRGRGCPRRRRTEGASVSIVSILRMEIIDKDKYPLILVTELEAMRSM